MAINILMSEFNGKSAHILDNESKEKSIEMGMDIILFPENGKHPQFHMEIADKYLQQNKDVCIVTHSENLLLRAMRRIGNGDVTKDDVNLFVLTPYINHPEKGFYWKKIDIDEDGEFIDHINGGFFEQGYRERFDLGTLEPLSYNDI